jgi:dehydrogenase/reductase SDR family member 4
MNTHTLPAFNLSGRIALVTGASKGMGRSIAAILAQAGARVVISSRNQADCDRVAAEISPDPGQCTGIASNIGDSQTLQTLVATTQSNVGKPDILSSIVGSRGRSGVGVYATTKAAVNQLVRTMAVEWGPFQVRTNAIAPTAVRTDFSRVLWDTPDALVRATARVPMGRIGEADDVAGLALLLASPAGSFINGQIIGVDGGASAW